MRDLKYYHIRSQYHKAGKDGLLPALSTLIPKRRATDIERGSPRDDEDDEEEEGPADHQAHHASTAPVTSSTAYSNDTSSPENISPVTKRTITDINGDPEFDATEKNTDPEGRPRSGSPSMEEQKLNGWQRFKRKLFEPSGLPVKDQIRKVLFPNWITINWLLLMVPVGIGLHFTHVNPLAIFIINFLAIVPLAGILSFATEEIALRVGEVIGGLLNASFGNAVELIVGVIALAKGEIIIVQTSLVGSMLSNLLLVMGMCFFFGGWNRTHQNFNTTVAQTAASLLALSVGSLIIPTAYTWGNTNFNPSKSGLDEKLSRGTAIILLVVYASYLFFQLKSHKDMFSEPSTKVAKKPKKKHHNVRHAMAKVGHQSGAHALGTRNQDFRVDTNPPAIDDDELEKPTLSFFGAIFTLCVATAFIGINAEFLVDSISEVTCLYGVSDYFVGLILLPIVGNAAEHATAVTVAIKDKMDLAIGVAVGSSMQIALLVIPLMVVLGWIIHQDMTLLFDSFQIAVLFVAIILVNYLIADGKSHWLEGVLLMALYIIIALSAYFYPQQNTNNCSKPST